MKRPAILYSSNVMHRRTRPAPYRFVYRVFSLLVDIDRLDEVHRMSILLSVNKFNLCSFHESDHLPEGIDDMRTWVNGVLRSHHIPPENLVIKLLCFPRVLGHVFNPLSIWYCEDRQGNPLAVICEVRNTFGERHCYLMSSDEKKTWPVLHRCNKEFHVSPFIDMQAEYHFRLAKPGDQLSVLITEYENNELLLVASQNGVARALSTTNLILQLFRVPFQTLKVLFAIHWQALKIWLHGTPFHSKPSPPIKEVS